MIYLLWIFLIAAQEGNFNVNSKGVVAEGYDLVSYFEGNAEKGSSEFVHEMNGAKFYFTGKKHLELFKSNPDQYLPKYGGWCAYAMAESGDRVEINPKTFTVTNGNLYLFYNSWGNNTLEPWSKDESKMILKADQNWAKKYEKK